MATVPDNLTFLFPAGTLTVQELSTMLGGQQSVPVGVALDRLAERKRKADLVAANRALVLAELTSAFGAFAQNPSGVAGIAAGLITRLEEAGILRLEDV